MKKLYILFPILFLAAFAFSSCQKEISPVETNEQELVTIVFNAEKVGDLPTKTAASEGSESVSYVWTDEDINNIKLFYVTEDENSEITLAEVENPVVTKVSDKRLNISAEVAPNATYTFRAILCNTYTNTNNPRIKAAQTPSGKNNYDPNADILVSADTEVTVGAGADAITTGPLELSFARKVVINKMTLKNLGTTETVSRVVVRSTSENKHLLGSVSKTGEMNPLTTAGDEITLYYNNEPVQSNGEFPVYFISMAQTDVVLEVEVYTDQYIYSKTFGRGINLNLGQFTTFGVLLPQGIPATALPSGDYFITGSNGDNDYAAKAYNASNTNLRGLGISINTTNQSIAYVNGLEDCIYTFTRITEGTYAGYYTIQDVNGLYLYAASNDQNQLKGESFTESLPNADKYYWSITKNSDGTYAIVAKDDNLRNVMRFNYNNGSPLFSCYTGGQSPITLYPASWCDFESAVATPTFNPAEGTYTSTQNVSISCATEGATIYYTTDGSDPTSSSTQYTTEIPISTTTTVKAIAKKNDVYSGIATATYTISGDDGTTYSKVTSAPSDWSGIYLIVYEESSTSGRVCTAGVDAASNYETATIASNVITSNDLSDCEVEIAPYLTGYSIKALGGTNANKFLEGQGSNTNGTTFKDSPTKATTLSLSNETVTITNNTNVFRYNSSNNNWRWRFFKPSTTGSSYKLPALYKKITSNTETTVATPSISPNGGTYTSSQTVSISCNTSGATIHYTTDGTTPNANSPVYNSAFIISETTTVKAIAVKDGLNNSAIATASFIITEGDGTAEHPYTVADALIVISSENATNSPVYVHGIISRVDSYLSDYHSITYFISDDGSTDSELQIYSGKNFGGTDFSSINDLAADDVVTVCGILKDHNGTPEMNYDNYLTYLNGKTKLLSSIAVSGQTTSFSQNDPFVFGGTVTATYTDDSTADVTSSSIFTGYNMANTGPQTVTVTYAEDGVEKTTTYTISVSGGTMTQSILYYETFGTANNNTASNQYDGWSWTGSNHPSGWKVSKSNLTGTNSSAGAYTDASGYSNLFSGATGESSTISFGDISSYSNVVLSFGWANNAGGGKARTLTVEVSGNNGSSWTSITFTDSSNATTNDGFHLFTYSVPSSLLNGFSVRFTNTSTNTSRIDDIKLVGDI